MESIKSLSQEGTKHFFQVILDTAKGLKKFAINESKIYSATQEYADNFLRRNGSVKILGMVEPVSLQQLYTEVHIVKSHEIDKNKLDEDLESQFRRTRGNYISGSARASAMFYANERNRLNVLGAPGSGKTTLLRKIGVESLITYENPNDQVYSHKSIPVLLELKRFKNEKIDLKTLIQKEFEIAGFPESSIFLERALTNGKLLILLDGLDEVPEDKLSELLEHLRDFCDKYHQNRFVTSCRTAYYRNYLPVFTDVEISNFNDDQIKQFIYNWFTSYRQSEVETAERFISTLFKVSNQSALELARTPLLLTFLCLSYDDTQRLPTSRAALYQQALNILMFRWAAEKRIHQDDIYYELSLDLEIELLADIAQHFFSEDKIFFGTTELHGRLKQFLSERTRIEKFDTRKILHAIEVQQGILVERALGKYSFSHLTIQEYLTAHYFRSGKLNLIVETHLFNRRWREVFLLLAQMGDINDLLVMMVKRLNEFKKNDKMLSDFSSWCRSILPKSKDFLNDSIRRVYLMSIILGYRRYGSGIFTEDDRMEDYSNDLIKLISKSSYNEVMVNRKVNMGKREAVRLASLINRWIPYHMDTETLYNEIKANEPDIPLGTMIIGSRYKYYNKLIDIFHSFLKTPKNLISRQKKNYYKTLSYLEACALVIECAKSSQLTQKQVINDIYNCIL